MSGRDRKRKGPDSWFLPTTQRPSPFLGTPQMSRDIERKLAEVGSQRPPSAEVVDPQQKTAAPIDDSWLEDLGLADIPLTAEDDALLEDLVLRDVPLPPRSGSLEVTQVFSIEKHKIVATSFDDLRNKVIALAEKLAVEGNLKELEKLKTSISRAATAMYSQGEKFSNLFGSLLAFPRAKPVSTARRDEVVWLAGSKNNPRPPQS